MPRSIARDVGGKVEDSETAVQIMHMVAHLEGARVTRTEQAAASAIGAAVRSFDDAFDRFDVRTARQNGAVILGGLDGKPMDGLPPRLIRAITLAQENLHPEAHAALRALTHAQIASLDQRNFDITPQAVERITRQKGASSVLLFALEMNPRMSEARRACYEELGFLVQLIDDAHDRDTDVREGVVTLVTMDATRQQTFARLRQQREVVMRAFQKEYPEERLTNIFRYIDTLLARAGFVEKY